VGNLACQAERFRSALQLPEPDPGVHRLLAGVGKSWVLSQYDPVANGIDVSQLERVSPIE